MGVRRIEKPWNVTEDAVFPDYNQANLEGVKEEWNATSFVILRKDTIVSLKAGRKT